MKMDLLFKTLRIVFTLLIIVFNIYHHPTTTQIADDTPIELQLSTKEGEKTVKAYYIWEQKSINLFSLVYIMPVKKELYLYSRDHKVKWEINKDALKETKARMGIPFATPKWKFALGTFSIIFLIMTLMFSYNLQNVLIGLLDLRKAKKEDTYRAYNLVLQNEKYPKWIKNKAREGLKRNIHYYKQFLRLVTLKTNGKLKNVIYKILDCIGETGNVDVNVNFSTSLNIVDQYSHLKNHEHFLRAIVTKLNNKPEVFNLIRDVLFYETKLNWSCEEIEILFNETPDISAIKECITIKANSLNKLSTYNYRDLTTEFVEKKHSQREEIIVKYLNNVFAKIFPDKIINIRHNCDSSINFNINSTFQNLESYGWWVTDENVKLEDRLLLPDIECMWDFYVDYELKGKTYKSDLINSTTSYPSYTGKKDGLYTFRITSAFTKFSEEIASSFGMINSKQKSSNGNSKNISAFYNKFKQECIDYLEDELLDLPESFIKEYYDINELSIEDCLMDLEYTQNVINDLQELISASVDSAEGIANIFNALVPED